MRSRPRRPSVSPGCAGGSSPGSRETHAPFPGARRAGRRTRSLWRKSWSRGRPRLGLRGPTQGSLSVSPRGWLSRNRPWASSKTRLGYSDSGEANGGVVPRTRRELERLPGIGPYTASAVLAIVYGQAEPLLDANLARLLGRCFGLSQTLSRSSRRRLLQALALHLVRDERSLQVNWAALDFGTLVCRPRRPLCPCCPLRSACAYALLLEPPATPSAGAP